MITQELLELYSQDDTTSAGAVQILAEGVQLGLQTASHTPAPGAGLYAMGKMPADNTKNIVAMMVHTSDIVKDAFLPYFDAYQDLGMEPGSICDMLMRTGNPHGKGMLTIPDDKLRIRRCRGGTVVATRHEPFPRRPPLPRPWQKTQCHRPDPRQSLGRGRWD